MRKLQNGLPRSCLNKAKMAAKMDVALLQSKFRGSMLGALIGDCCGAPFEGEVLGSGDKITLRKYFDKLEGPFFKAPVKAYTDDTAMTKCVARVLIEHKDIPHAEMAGSFMREYFQNPKRGYGSAVIEVFQKLRKSKLVEPLVPASEQFNGLGSYGNGAAMRIAPIGLFCHNKPEKLSDLVTKCSEITHTHHLGIRGAILQATAVNLCITTQADSFNADSFLENVLSKMKDVEKDDEGLGLKVDTSYQMQVNEIRKLLERTPSDDDVLNKLGHSVAALYSVPTAIYIFLKAQDNIEGIETENPFRRTLEYAISLGGDTDTIASMAGALTGTLHGDSVIPENLRKHCEGADEIVAFANDLYKASEC